MTLGRNFKYLAIGAGWLLLWYFSDQIRSWLNYIYAFFACGCVMFISKMAGDADNKIRVLQEGLNEFNEDNRTLTVDNNLLKLRLQQLEAEAKKDKEIAGNFYDYPKAIDAAYAELMETRNGHARAKTPLTEIATSADDAIETVVAISYLNGMVGMAGRAADIAANFTRKRSNSLNTQQQIAALIHKEGEKFLPKSS